MGATFLTAGEESYVNIKRVKDEKCSSQTPQYLGILHTIWQHFPKYEKKNGWTRLMFLKLH